MPPVPDGLDGREKLGIILTGPSQVVADELSRHFCCPFDERLCREALSQVRYLNQTRLARCNGLPHGAGWVVVGHPFGFFHSVGVAIETQEENWYSYGSRVIRNGLHLLTCCSFVPVEHRTT